MVKFLPDKLDIMGRTYDIVFPYEFTTSNAGTAGLHDGVERNIRLADIVHGLKIPIPFIHATLLHEIVHAIIAIFTTIDSPEISESVVDGMSFGTYQVIVDNKELFGKQIPKTIRIGGFDYKVNYPYKFDDEENACIAVNSSCGTILLDDEGCKEHQLERLAFGIFSAIYYIYVGGRSITELKMNLDEGLHSTIMRNDLAKLFRKYNRGCRNAS